MKGKKVFLTPEAFVEIYMQHYVDGKTGPQAAKAMGLTRGGFAARVHCYRKRGVNLPKLTTSRKMGRLDVAGLNGIVSAMRAAGDCTVRWIPSRNGDLAVGR